MKKCIRFTSRTRDGFLPCQVDGIVIEESPNEYRCKGTLTGDIYLVDKKTFVGIRLWKNTKY